MKIRKMRPSETGEEEEEVYRPIFEHGSLQLVAEKMRISELPELSFSFYFFTFVPSRLSCAGPGEGWAAGNGRLALQRLHCAASCSPRPQPRCDGTNECLLL